MDDEGLFLGTPAAPQPKPKPQPVEQRAPEQLPLAMDLPPENRSPAPRGDFRFLPRPADAGMPSLPPYTGPLVWPTHMVGRRNVVVRVLLTIGLWLAGFIVWLICALISLGVSEASGGDGGSGLMLVLLPAAFAPLVCAVSYRVRDTFLMYTPIYGVVFITMIFWRVANLPHRDWAPRPEELARLYAKR